MTLAADGIIQKHFISNTAVDLCVPFFMEFTATHVGFMNVIYAL